MDGGGGSATTTQTDAGAGTENGMFEQSNSLRTCRVYIHPPVRYPRALLRNQPPSCFRGKGVTGPYNTSFAMLHLGGHEYKGLTSELLLYTARTKDLRKYGFISLAIMK